MASPDLLQFPRTCNVGPPLAALVCWSLAAIISLAVPPSPHQGDQLESRWRVPGGECSSSVWGRHNLMERCVLALGTTQRCFILNVGVALDIVSTPIPLRFNTDGDRPSAQEASGFLLGYGPGLRFALT